MTTSAERTRRWRRHKIGDHSLCLPERCRERARQIATRGAQRPGGALTPLYRATSAESRGDTLRAGLSATTDASPAAVVLIEEAARVTDRLDRLAEQLDGNKWVQSWAENFASGMSAKTVRVNVTMDAALAESRQQALALKSILAELSRYGQASFEPEGEPNPVTSLAERIATRRDTRG